MQSSLSTCDLRLSVFQNKWIKSPHLKDFTLQMGFRNVIQWCTNLKLVILTRLHLFCFSPLSLPRATSCHVSTPQDVKRPSLRFEKCCGCGLEVRVYHFILISVCFLFLLLALTFCVRACLCLCVCSCRCSYLYYIVIVYIYMILYTVVVWNCIVCFI